jgi:uncharacterized protein
MSRTQQAGSWALVTGASSGLGVDFARELARRGVNVILAARRRTELLAVAEELRSDHGVVAEVIALDLGQPNAADQLYEQVTALGHEVDILVNNAGFGLFGHYLDIGWEREKAMIDLDIGAVVRLTQLFSMDMVRRGRGRILQVASVAAYQPTPTYAAYGAAKAFVLHYGEAVAEELAGTGVTCTVVSPGYTRTAFLEVSGQPENVYHRALAMTSAAVARIGIKAMLRGRRSIVPGSMNALIAWLTRFVPRRVSAAIVHRLMAGSRAPQALAPAGPGSGD